MKEAYVGVIICIIVYILSVIVMICINNTKTSDKNNGTNAFIVSRGLYFLSLLFNVFLFYFLDKCGISGKLIDWLFVILQFIIIKVLYNALPGIYKKGSKNKNLKIYSVFIILCGAILLVLNIKYKGSIWADLEYPLVSLLTLWAPIGIENAFTKFNFSKND